MQFLQRQLTAVLCLMLVCPGVPAQTQAQDADHATANSTPRMAYPSDQRQSNPLPRQGDARQRQDDARILHALNRFTFGPRPGDLDAVRAMGLEKWFDQQLHPNSIDEVDLRTRLAQFPAMQWNPPELMYRAPSNAIIRQAIDGKLRVPERGALHAVYENQIYRVSEKREEKQQKAGEQQKMQTAAGKPPGSADSASEPPSMQAGNTHTHSAADANPTDMVADSSDRTTVLDDSEFRGLLDLDPQQRVSRLVAMKPDAFEGLFKSLRPPQRAALLDDLTPDLREVVLDLENPQRMVTDELIAQRLTRDIYSSAQLQEVMTDFWLNHFNIFIHKDPAMPYFLLSFERDVIRPRALGKFEDLLEATAHSPAMLLYLDNASSIGPNSLAAERAQFRQNNKKRHEGLNENYARELMELHTVGVNGGYTQADVTQVARILTGWTVDRPQRGGGFQFDPRRHEPGTKVVMGKKFKDHGEQEGHELLHMLATRPATAQFICRKLAVRFVSDNPPQALVDRMAKTFLNMDGDISAVLTTLLHSPVFWDTSMYRAKVKTPIEFVVSAARASNADIANMLPLANAVRAMGMPLYGCLTPNGYAWNAETWVSTNALVNRMNFALSFAANRLPRIATEWQPTQIANNAATALQADSTAPDAQAEEARLQSVLLPGGVSETTRAAVLQQFEQQQNQFQNTAVPFPVAAGERQRLRVRAVSAAEKQDQLLAGLLLGSPEFQRR